MLNVDYEGEDQELEMGQKKQGSLDAMRLWIQIEQEHPQDVLEFWNLCELPNL